MQADRSATAALARYLLGGSGPAALASLGPGGEPFASHVLSAPDEDGSPVLLLSRLAVHTANLARDPRASLLLVRAAGKGADAMTAARLTLTGRVTVHPDQASASRAFLSRQPEAALYAGFRDFAFYRFDVLAGHVVAGFGRIVDLTADELLGANAPAR
jgi:putative heme iron utilization protein